MSKSPTCLLTEELIRRPSITPDDAGCQDILIARLEKLGFTIHRLPFGEVKNFWATHGQGKPTLCFAGHTDVVPPGPESDWHTPPFDPVIKDGILYGRGAADMKGSLAAMITAVEAFIADHPNHKGRIAFLITSDEEGIATDGTVKVVDWLAQQGEMPEYCIVGEPSSGKAVGDIIKNGRRGSLGCTLKIKGVQGHVAYPQLADNPIHKAAPALVELTQQVWDNGNDFFPATSFQISNINGGTGADNVIPGELAVLFNFRYSTETNDRELMERTEAILKKHHLEYETSWRLSGKPFLTSQGELVDATLASIQEIAGIKSTLSTAGGTSDGRFIAPHGAQVVELGPVNATIHKKNEQVSVAELDTLNNIYQGILQKLLG